MCERMDIPFGRVTVIDAAQNLRRKSVHLAKRLGTFYDELSVRDKRIAMKWMNDEFGEWVLPYIGQRIPSIFMIQDEEVLGALIFREEKDGPIHLDYAYCEKVGEKLLAGILHKAITAMMEEFDPGQEIHMLLSTTEGLRLYEGLFGAPEESKVLISGTIGRAVLGDVDTDDMGEPF